MAVIAPEGLTFDAFARQASENLDARATILAVGGVSIVNHAAASCH
jgi:hypothetical protein